MDWIFKNIELVALVVLAIGSAIKQLTEAAKAKRETTSRRDETEEEYEDPPTWIPVPIPPEYQAPPPLPPPALPPLFPQFAPQPVLENTDDLLRKQREMEDKMRELKARKAQSRQIATRPGDIRQKASSAAAGGIQAMLRKPSSARQAIVLREILGAPVGLR